MGRHSHPDELDDAVDSVDVVPVAPPKTTAVADVQFLLHNPRVLIACLIAAIVPFICYFTVMIGQSRMASWAVYVGAPLVLAGVLVGTVLDRAYARREAALRAAHADTGPIMTEVVAAAPGSAGAQNSRSVEGARS
jgi:hypothetical protein